MRIYSIALLLLFNFFFINSSFSQVPNEISRTDSTTQYPTSIQHFDASKFQPKTGIPILFANPGHENYQPKHFVLPQGKFDFPIKTINFKEIPLNEVIKSLFQLLNVDVEFNENLNEIVTIKCEDKSIGQALDEIFDEYKLEGELTNDKIKIKKK